MSRWICEMTAMTGRELLFVLARLQSLELLRVRTLHEQWLRPTASRSANTRIAGSMQSADSTISAGHQIWQCVARSSCIRTTAQRSCCHGLTALASACKLCPTFEAVKTKQPRYVGGRRSILQGTWRAIVLFPHAGFVGHQVSAQKA